LIWAIGPDDANVHPKILMMLELILMDIPMLALADDAKAEAQICNKNRYYGIALISL
jgi:hypothetical protein